jgi:hypothetical protein
MTTRSWHELQLSNNSTQHDSNISHKAEAHLPSFSNFKNNLFERHNTQVSSRQKTTLSEANDACTYDLSDCVKEKICSNSSSSSSSYARTDNKSSHVTRRRYSCSSSNSEKNLDSQSATLYGSANEKRCSESSTASDESSDNFVHENLSSSFSKSQESLDDKLQESLSSVREKPFQHYFHKWLNLMVSRNPDMADWCISEPMKNVSESDGTTDDYFQTNHAKIQSMFCDNILITNRIDEMFTRLQNNIRSSFSRLQQFKTEISCEMDEIGHCLKDCELTFTRDKQKFNTCMDEEIHNFIMSGWARSGHLGFIDISKLFEPVLKNKRKHVAHSRRSHDKNTQENKDHSNDMEKNGLLLSDKVKTIQFSELFPESSFTTLQLSHYMYHFKCCNFTRERTRNSLNTQALYRTESPKVNKHRKGDKLNKMNCENNRFKSSKLAPNPKNFLVINDGYYLKDIEGSSEQEKAFLFLSNLLDKTSTKSQSDSSSESLSSRNCLSMDSTNGSLLKSENMEENQPHTKNAWLGDFPHCARQTINCMGFLTKSNVTEPSKIFIPESSKESCKTNQIKAIPSEKMLPGDLSPQIQMPPCEPKYNLRNTCTKNSSKQSHKCSSNVFLYDSENSDDGWIKTSPAAQELKFIDENNEERASSTGGMKQKETKFFFKSCTLLQEIHPCFPSNRTACVTEKMYTTTFVIGNMDRKSNILAEVVQNICNTSLQDSFINMLHTAQDHADDLTVDESIQHPSKPTICHAGFTQLSQHHLGCVPARVTEFWQLANNVFQNQAVWIFRGRLITPLKNIH